LLDGEDVVVIDDLSTGYRDAIAGGRFYEGDLACGAFTRDVFEKENIEAVIHFAAFSLVGESYTNPGKYFRNNIGAGLTLMDAMAACGCKYLVFSSTAATYGEPCHIPISEDDPQRPTNPYGESKLAMERIMRWYALAHGLRFCPLRYFNVAGAWPDGSIGERHSPETHLVPLMLQTALKLHPRVTIYGDDYDTPDGTCIRDYIHVCDLVDGHVKALSYLVNGGECTPFNLGIGRGFSVLEMIDAAKEVTGLSIPVTKGPRRPGDPSILVACGQKAMDTLDWKPRYTEPRAIIADAWRWHSRQR
jgi:UDP-glucose 4-epimerase